MALGIGGADTKGGLSRAERRSKESVQLDDDAGLGRGQRWALLLSQDGALETAPQTRGLPCPVGVCATNSLSSANRRDNPFQDFFVTVCPWRLRAPLPEQGLWKIPPVAKEQAGTCRRGGICSQPGKDCCVQAEPHLGWTGSPGRHLKGSAGPVFFLQNGPQASGLENPFWFQWVQETESLECGLPGEGWSFFREEGLFNTVLCPLSPWKWQRGPNKKLVSLGKRGRTHQ